MLVVLQPFFSNHEYELGGPQGLRYGHGDAVGVGAVRLPLAIKSERRKDRNNAALKERLKEFRVNPLHLSGEQVIDALDDSLRMRNDGVRAGGTQIVGRKAFQDLMREAVRGVHGQLQRRSIGHPRAIQVGHLDALLLGERLNLPGCAVRKHHADVQRTQHGDVQKDVGEILGCDDDTIHRNHECLFAELRDVLKNPAQVRKLHVSTYSAGRQARSPIPIDESSTLHRN